jgi:prepilin-type N-terminal cleavage/methylation domain-containing protein
MFDRCLNCRPGVRFVSPCARACRAQSRGFTVLELLVVVAIMGLGLAVMISPLVVRGARADSGASRLAATLRTAREQAVSQRRNVRVAFTNNNQITVTRVNVPATSTTVLSTVYLEDGITFQRFNGVLDTPDGFGNGTAVSFGSATTIQFTSEGTFVDQNGDPVNGTVQVARYDDPTSLRAVTIFGPTALIRQWRYSGARWTR